MKEILPFVATWMNPEDLVLREINEMHKDKYYVGSLNEASPTVRLIEAESGRVVVRGWRRRK